MTSVSVEAGVMGRGLLEGMREAYLAEKGRKLPVSSRISCAGAIPAAADSGYLDHGLAWEGVVAIAAVALIVLVKRHQRQQDEQYARLCGPHRVQSRKQQTPPPSEQRKI